MIDIHCHLIPGIDDGAKDTADAVSLLRMAADDGITRMVITPHIHFGRFENSKAHIWTELLALKQAAFEANINIDLAAAAEVRIDADMLPMIMANKLPFLGQHEGQQFLLLELPHSHIPPGCENLIKWLRSRNITPLIAHPERNRDIQKNPERIKSLQRLGCWFQLTASSLLGHFGESCQALSVQFLEAGLIDVVASDAHNLNRRPPLLSNARAEVAQLLGEDEAQRLFWTNPYNITRSLFIIP
ncbi:tyrosine-protein phosphatase [Pseudoalteromonas tunicata]|jgi:protein-tyrosine phosphatase|uniref:protein-tyrosine-phosphatase n=1 Tax=Pseudoalteromonas tunicata D2 TaxID=87626 RepID=A4CBX9_9GAMM|nr:CpsB/CapC family capsule biosynthesis tyrosine phosphatase [Pseudoalteromonas tunicata]ATC94416.1 protein-tyrosine phosphatase [Pseudoalteromonas tunicata]AXT30149.1 capsule biosynthesis protein CapC [Pseudoalteromonas tunicata]EAR27866.1 putative Capsular polysaccharide biosynthesis, capC [Pseudoalteromonas tunicata D2]MDP4983990.1 capsule biosynthesis protein CapC [Pseudoalteromonas tunicata]MDP5211634.1 capsule biosynthesis protein CapC [Pseudoalteromonas tunicata]